MLYVHTLAEDLEKGRILALCAKIVMWVFALLVVLKNIILYYISSFGISSCFSYVSEVV